MTREIITLQIGHQANNVGVHFWNQLDIEQAQNNTLIDYNTYFTFNQKTNLASPRALIIDYRNTFGYLLDESDANLQKARNDPLIEVINRTTESNFWSSKLRTKARFHPKSLIPLAGHWYSPNPEEIHFDIYPIGQQLHRKMFDQIEHSLHYLLESADSVQSFRCVYDVNNSFSGVFTSIQDYVRDECPKQPMWSFGLDDQSVELNTLSSLIHSVHENQMPTSMCSISADAQQLGLAIQHALISSSLTLDLLAERLCPMKRNLLTLSWQIPLDLRRETLFHYIEDPRNEKLFPLSPPIACHYFLRGIEEQQLYNRSLYNLNINTSAELVSTYLREQFGSKMFLSTDSWTSKQDHMALLAGLSNVEKQSFEYFDQLMQKTRKLKYKQLSKRWEENEFDEQMFDQLLNELDNLHEQYRPNEPNT